MQYFRSFTLLFSLLFISCDMETVIDLEIPPHESVLVLNGILHTDTNVQVVVSNSVGAFSNNSPSFINDATVVLYKNGVFEDTLLIDMSNLVYVYRLDDNGNVDSLPMCYYKSAYIPEKDANYRIEVSHYNYNSISAETYIPNDIYLDNYYETMYGKQTRDAEGNMTKKRKFTFDPSLLPTYQGDLAGRTGVDVTSGEDFADYFSEGRTIAELEEGQQNIRDTRKYLFSAGLTNLQGEIDKETQKIKNQGAKDIAKIQQEGAIYGQLLGGFNF